MRWDENYKRPDPPINDPVIIPAYGVTDEERAYWNAKQQPLEYDPVPTQYSDHMMISGAIYNALEQYKVQTIRSCQDFYYTIAGGLEETQQIVTDAVDIVNAAKDAAAESQADAYNSKTAAAESESLASDYAQFASVSEANAGLSATNAQNSSYDSEAWATGKRNGEDVPSTDPTYHNNARYYAGLGSDIIQDNEVSDYTTWSSSKLTTDLAAKADLVAGKVPAAQLPSYVDDVEEYSSTSAFPATGETGKIYVAIDTNKTYRWGGSSYVEISESLALGETSTTAYPGNLGKATTDHLAEIAAVIPNTASSTNQLALRSELPVNLTDLNDDTLHRTVSDAEKTNWNSKAAGNHNHDDRYYTETEIDTKFNGVTFTTDDGVDYINW